MDRNTVVVLTESEIAVAEVVAAVESGGLFEVVSHTTEPGELAALVRGRAPALLLVRLEEKGDLLLDAVEALPAPRLPLIVLGPEDEGRLILRAMRLGAREYLPLDASEEQIARVLGAAVAGPTTDPKGKRAPVVAVLGAKGGVGASLVATQLALGLRGLGTKTALVDLDLRHGDASLYLDVHPTYGITDVVRNEGNIDADYLDNVLHTHASGLRLLAAPAQPEDAELVGAEPLTHVLRLLCASQDWVVLDVAREFDEVTLAALDLADQILLVAEPDVPALHHTRRILALLERLGCPGSRVRLVTNRCDQQSTIGERDLCDFVGRGSEVRIPNDYAAAQESVNYGRPVALVAPDSPLNAAFGELAVKVHEWCGRPSPAQPTAARGVRRFLPFLGSKRHGAD